VTVVLFFLTIAAVGFLLLLLLVATEDLDKDRDQGD